MCAGQMVPMVPVIGVDTPDRVTRIDVCAGRSVFRVAYAIGRVVSVSVPACRCFRRSQTVASRFELVAMIGRYAQSSNMVGRVGGLVGCGSDEREDLAGGS